MGQQDSTAASNGTSTDGNASSESPLLSGSRTTGGMGEGVDREIETSFFTPKRIGLIVIAVLMAAGLGYGVWSTATGGQVLNVDREKVTISTVKQGDFQEFIAVTGTAIPKQTVYLGAVEGGRVEEVFLEEGAMVEDGEPILRLSNNDLRLQLARTEARLAEQRSRMQQMQMDMEQRRLRLQQDLAQIRNELRRVERQFERQKRLHEQDLIAEQEFQDTRDNLQYQRRRLELTRSAYRQDSLTYQSRLDQQQEQRRRLDQRYETMQEAVESLTIRAPIDGQLTALNAELGQIIGAGTRIGQVDEVGRYELRAQIDEFYIERVQHGQTATTDAVGDTSRTLTVDRVYPEVEDGRFEVDLAFKGGSPADLRRGQTVRLKLQLGQPQQATLLARGGFYQSTGGNWAYVLTDDGEAAVRRPLRLGRQNPNHFEVLEGVEPGDKVITSSYDTFGDADRLSLQ
ncbi:HlyD family secretion protein [Salinibacter ruber]|uniref:efflux RND transporter periplasmic adaptor subunit n=1 Tax=Salinibacter ruber TaxID=146919 RepID=UPI00216763FE|nr:HlyD family efflux transporter periplasmic adaptor subunit [Salinibacter ruber]MCS3634084.1 HlyD family secretion protein [Salinibacter ruber]MCS3713574.1 HlyD family secretion protein [Salinibacter ruber]